MNETVDDRRPAGWIRSGLALLAVGELSVGAWALLVQVSLLACLVYSVPHFVFHLTHTRAGDNLANITLLGLLVALPLAILICPGLQGRNSREEGL